MPRDKPAQGGKGPVFPKLLRHWWKKRKTTQTNEKTYHVLGLEESILSRWPYYRNIKMPVRCYWLSCRLLQVLPIFLSASCANIQPLPRSLCPPGPLLLVTILLLSSSCTILMKMKVVPTDMRLLTAQWNRTFLWGHERILKISFSLPNPSVPVPVENKQQTLLLCSDGWRKASHTVGRGPFCFSAIRRFEEGTRLNHRIN